jgi:hypothetical protein
MNMRSNILIWRTFILFFLSYPSLSSSFLSVILACLIETHKSLIESCYSREKISSWLFNHRVWCAKEEKKQKRSPFLFFSNILAKWKFFLPGVDLFFLSLSLMICISFFSRSRATIQKKGNVHSSSIFFFLHTHIDILRETADILCALFDLLCTTSTRWYQLLSAGNSNKFFFLMNFLIISLFLIK